uniref:Uncharacterized protein n=1 Tax=Micrurus lemniscatus lemniscatus TaxID=129467 RepID=A0A2D4ICR1_MICLE
MGLRVVVARPGSWVACTCTHTYGFGSAEFDRGEASYPSQAILSAVQFYGRRRRSGTTRVSQPRVPIEAAKAVRFLRLGNPNTSCKAAAACQASGLVLPRLSGVDH